MEDNKQKTNERKNATKTIPVMQKGREQKAIES